MRYHDMTEAARILTPAAFLFCQDVFVIDLFKRFETRANIASRFYPDQDKRIRFHRLSHADSQVQFIEANRSAD